MELNTTLAVPLTDKSPLMFKESRVGAVRSKSSVELLLSDTLPPMLRLPIWPMPPGAI